MDFSASTQSVTIAMGTQVLKTADVSRTSSLCTAATGGGRTCTVALNAPSGNDTFTVTAYDQANGTGNAIARGTLQQSTSAQPTPVQVVVSGTIAKLAVSLSNPYPLVGTKATVNVLVTGSDVDGNVVIGPYSSPITLKDSDTSGVTSLSTATVADSSTAVTLSYTGADPFISATVTASATGFAPATATFAPVPALLNSYNVPTHSGPLGFGTAVGVWNITKGPDGNMWVVATEFPEVLKVAPDGTMTPYPLSNPFSMPQGIVTGADGNLWFAESGTSTIGKITPAGAITEYPVPGSIHPDCVTLGPDGNVWFGTTQTAFGGSAPGGGGPGIGPIGTPPPPAQAIGSITPSGSVTVYPLSTAANIAGIASGPDGNIWVSNQGQHDILKVSTSGQILATYPFPDQSTLPAGLSGGPDGNIWITEWGGKIARMSTSGALTEFTLPTTHSYPESIVPGPDGRMWFAEQGNPAGGGKVGVITLDGKQIHEYVEQGRNIRDLAFDAKGVLWSLELTLDGPGAANFVDKFAY